MTRTLYYGILVGFYISTGLLASELLFPSPAFGILPLWLVVLPSAAFLLIKLFGTPEPGAKKGSGFIPAGAAAVTPFAVYGLYTATNNGAFIGQAGFLSFLLLWLMLALLVGLPILLLTKQLYPGSSISSERFSFFALIGAAAGLFLHQQFAGAVPIAVLTIATAALTAVFPFVKDRPGTLKPSKVDSKPGPAKATGKKSREHGPAPSGRKRVQSQKFHPAATYIIAIVILIAYPVWAFVHIQKAAQYLAAGSWIYGIWLPAAAAAVALGLFLSGRIKPEQRVLGLIPGLLVFAGGLIIGMYRWQMSLFPDLYTAYYIGADTMYFLSEWLVWALLLPSLAAGFLLGLVRPEAQPNGDAAFIAGLIAFLAAAIAFVPGFLGVESVHILFIVIGSGLTLLISWFIGRHIGYTLAVRIPITIAIGGALLVLTVRLPEPGFENLFDPASFKILFDGQSPGGRTTLLQARNYDDPFYTVFWNHSLAITQNSNDAKPDLQRTVHLPMMLHPQPERILMLGMGSFERMKAMDMYKPKSVVVVDQNPALFTSYAIWLKDIKKERPPYLRFHAERLPAFAARNSETFDVVLSGEPFATPFRLPDIFTTDYYTDLKRAIGASGIFVQWLPLDGLTEGTFASIAAAMKEVFPHTRLWMGSLNEGSSMAAVIGSNSDISIPPRFRTVLAEISEDPETALELLRIGLPMWEYLAAEYGGGSDAVAWIAGDAIPLQKFDTKPLYIPAQETAGNGVEYLRILERRTFEPALVAGVSDSVKHVVESLFRTRPQTYRAAAQLRATADTSAVRELIGIVQEQPYNLEARYALANGLVRQAAEYVSAGNYAPAQPMLLQATSIAPLTTYMLRLLMIASFQIGDTETAQTSLNGIKRLHPKHGGAKDNEATLKAQRGMVQDALLLYENAITLDPSNEEFYCNMASAQFNGGRPWEAVRILDNAVKKSYYPARVYMLQGMIYGEGGKIDLAIEAYENFLRVAKPNDPNRAVAVENVRKLAAGSSL